MIWDKHGIGRSFSVSLLGLQEERAGVYTCCTVFRFGLLCAMTELRYLRSAWKMIFVNEQEQSPDISDIRQPMVEAVYHFIVPILLY